MSECVADLFVVWGDSNLFRFFFFSQQFATIFPASFPLPTKTVILLLGASQIMPPTNPFLAAALSYTHIHARMHEDNQMSCYEIALQNLSTATIL